MLEATASALHMFTDPNLLLFILGGLVVGVVIGVVPAIGSMFAIALFLPFTFRIPLEYSVAFMLTICATSPLGGSITTILVNIPGDVVNAATLADGYPMAKKGQAGRALGAAMVAAASGGILTVFMCLATFPLILPWIMHFQSAEMVFVVLMGLCFTAVIAGDSMIKGLMSGGLGVLIAFVGIHPITGIERYTWGSLYLYDGVPLIPIGLGMFAVAQVVAFAMEGQSKSMYKEVAGFGGKGFREVIEGGKDVFRHWGVWLRSAIIGYVVGVLPGIGGMTGIFVAYGQAKQISKHPEEFGKGAVEGVIAPETAHNAGTAGDLLCTLALGIPGSAVMALLLAAFLMAGIIPGPDMLTKHLDMSINMMLVLMGANILACVICLPIAPKLARLAYVPSAIMAPITLAIALMGVYAYDSNFTDVVVCLIFGAVGVLFGKFGYNKVALMLGFVLGGLFEKYLFIAYATAGPVFFLRPLSLVMIFIILLLFGFSPLKKLIKSKIGANRGSGKEKAAPAQ